MILFYSDNCGHCKMLLETIKRYNSNNLVKCVSIDMLRGLGKELPQIHSVPALMIMPSKKIIFGKQVFDYLLLPKSGFLLKSTPNTSQDNDSNKQNQQIDNSEPLSFSINSSKFSDNYAMLDDDNDVTNNGLFDQSYKWSSIDENIQLNNNVIQQDIGIETRNKKEPIDLNDIYAKRALEIEQSDLNINQLPPPNTTR